MNGGVFAWRPLPPGLSQSAVVDLDIWCCLVCALSAVHCRIFTIEDAIGYIAADELIEVTPDTAIRLRKRILDSSKRKSDRKATAAAA